MASSPIISWQIDGETVEAMADFIFRGSKITADGDCSREIKRCEHLHQMMQLTDNALTQMNRLMAGRKESYDINRTFNIENEINNFRNQLKSQNIVDINNHEYTYAVGTIYMDLINECEKLGDYVVNVVEARMNLRQR